MTQRSIRRAQERKARKESERQARKRVEQNHFESEVENTACSSSQLQTEPLSEAKESSCPEPHHPLASTAVDRTPAPHASLLMRSRSLAQSPARTAANQSNAQLSTGPRSAEGKSTSSLNAVKTALTGRTVLLPSDDAAAYENHLEAWRQDFQPVGARESDLVQSIADSSWRLQRIPGLEAAIFALGHVEFAESFLDYAPELRVSMLELHTFLKYEKQLRNLQIQETRLVNRRRRDLAELEQLQQQRRDADSERQQAALETGTGVITGVDAKQPPKTQTPSQASEQAVSGFVFSSDRIEQLLECDHTGQPTPKAAQQAA